MRIEDMDGTPEGTTLDITEEQADQLRAEHEADERAKVIRRQEERDEWFRALARVRLADAAKHADELRADLEWARTVILEGERFRDGLALYLVLYTARKMATGRSLSYTETARLRRAVLVLFPEVAERAVA